MSAQPIHPHPEPDRVPRNAEGIAAALEGERRMEFYRTLPTRSVAVAIARRQAAGLPVE
ncbi:hypothetical protein [Streptomyces hygroscopicus]|uniref:hypothetical protein n=1 Tax=Streptomyces hygroscopicus TaxID=1912 RepID=UPI0036CC3C23